LNLHVTMMIRVVRKMPFIPPIATNGSDDALR